MGIMKTEHMRQSQPHILSCGRIISTGEYEAWLWSNDTRANGDWMLSFEEWKEERKKYAFNCF